MKTTISLAVAVIAAGLLLGMNASRAAEADWAPCQSAESPDGQIAACTRILNDQDETKEARAEAYYLRANAEGDKGEFDKSIADYDKAIGLAENAVYYASRGWAYTEKGDTARALQDCEKAIALNPNLALGYANRGAVYEKKGDLAKAIADYKAALAVKSDLDEELVGQDDAKQALARLTKKSAKTAPAAIDQGDVG